VSLPLGADSTKVKISAAREAILSGADEIDMVADLAAVTEGDEKYLAAQFQAVRRVCRSLRAEVVIKVIIEAAALPMDRKLFVCGVAERSGVDFIKTSTGMHEAGGATAQDVRLIKQAAPSVKVKAAGGIKTAADALEMIHAGADRIGTSSGVEIINQLLSSR